MFQCQYALRRNDTDVDKNKKKNTFFLFFTHFTSEKRKSYCLFEKKRPCKVRCLTNSEFITTFSTLIKRGKRLIGR